MLGRRRQNLSDGVPVEAQLCKGRDYGVQRCPRRHSRLNDSSKHLATTGIIKEHLVLAQGWEVGSNFLHVHGRCGDLCL